MKSVLASTRYLLMAVLALPAVGCGGCTVTVETPDWDDWGREVLSGLYQQVGGPIVLTSAVGAAAPPGAGGGLNAIGMDLAWRAWLEQQDHLQYDAAAAASAVGTAATLGACGRLSAMSALVGQDDQRELLMKSRRIHGLFEVQQPHQPKTVRRQIVLGDGPVP